MTRRTRILLVVLGFAALAAAIWISINVRFALREVTYTDESVDVDVIAPAGS